MYRYRTFVIKKTDKAEPRTAVRWPPHLNTVEGVHRTSDSQMEVIPRTDRSRGHTVHGTEILKQPLLPATSQLKEKNRRAD